MGGKTSCYSRRVTRILSEKWVICLAVFFVALAVRLGYVLSLRGTPITDVLLIDSETYDRLARLILAGKFHGEEVYAMNPLYPYFLGGVYAVSGASRLAVFVVQAVLDAGSCAMIAWLGWTFFGRATGMLAGLGAVLYGPLVFYCGALLTPTLVLFLVVCALVLLARWRMLRASRLCFWAGVFLGLAALGRGSNALLVVLSLGFFRIETGAWRRGVKPWGLVLVGAALVIGVMALRDRMVEGHLVPVSANVAAFYIGHNPEATGLYQMPSFTSGAAFTEEVWGTRDALARKLGHPLTLAQASSWLVHEGMSFALDHPLAEARLLALKFYYFWNRTEAATNLSYYFARDFSAWLRAMPLHFGLIAPLGLVGIVLQRRRWREHALLHMCWLAGLLTALVFFVSAEYRVPAIPALFVFAANVPVVLVGWMRVWLRRTDDETAGNALKGSIQRNVAVALVCLLVFGVFCNVRNERLRFQSLKRVDYLNFGVLYKDRGDLGRAETMLTRSLAIDPSYGPAYAALADLKHKQGKEVEAARYAREAFRYQPVQALSDSTAVNQAAIQTLIVRAGELYQGRQYAESLKLFDAVKAHADKSGDTDMARSALNNMGLCQLQLGKLDSAEVVFQTIMASDPTYVKAINNLAKVRLAEGRKEEARQLFRRVLEIDPQNRIAQTELKKLGG